MAAPTRDTGAPAQPPQHRLFTCFSPGAKCAVAYCSGGSADNSRTPARGRRPMREGPGEGKWRECASAGALCARCVGVGECALCFSRRRAREDRPVRCSCFCLCWGVPRDVLGGRPFASCGCFRGATGLGAAPPLLKQEGQGGGRGSAVGAKKAQRPWLRLSRGEIRMARLGIVLRARMVPAAPCGSVP